MGKKSVASVNKSKEKRQARKLEQRRIADGMSYVTSANKLKELVPLCKELLMYKNKDLEIDMYIQKVTELDKKVLDWAIDLTERNMKYLYETCAWGWNKEDKVEQMMDDAAWYLIAKDKNDELQAFSHFRFDMDFGDPVLYCYELQIEAGGRRRGLGQRVMSVLERLAQATRMRCVRLTALTHNPSAAAFFRACGGKGWRHAKVREIQRNCFKAPLELFLKNDWHMVFSGQAYTLDETSPPKEEISHYEILSKATETTDEDTTKEQLNSRIDLAVF